MDDFITEVYVNVLGNLGLIVQTALGLQKDSENLVSKQTNAVFETAKKQQRSRKLIGEEAARGIAFGRNIC